MKFPENLKYTRDHEWAQVKGNQVTVGITDHAQSALGDVVYLELPQVGRTVKKGETFGVVESIKAVSDLYSPVSGKVVEINSALVSEPSGINQDPYEVSWMVRIELTEPVSASDLLDAASYRKYVESLK